MEHRWLVRRLAANIPFDLRRLRGKLMLEQCCETLGVEEVQCPACRGTGWLDRDELEQCPVCGGFREVPTRLAQWFRAQAFGIEKGVLVSCEPARDRYGRAAEVLYHVDLQRAE